MTDLSPRQREVLALVAQGLTDREIAARLGIAHHTARDHVREVQRRLGVSSRTAAAVAWTQRGLVPHG